MSDESRTKKAKRIPKRIGGIKIPKELRRTGEALIDQAASPRGREMLAGALTLAAAAATAAVAKGRAPGPGSPSAPVAPDPTAPPPPQGTSREPDLQAIAETIGHTAEMMLGRLFTARK